MLHSGFESIAQSVCRQAPVRVQLSVDEDDRDLLPPQLVERGVVLDRRLDDLDPLGSRVREFGCLLYTSDAADE